MYVCMYACMYVGCCLAITFLNLMIMGVAEVARGVIQQKSLHSPNSYIPQTKQHSPFELTLLHLRNVTIVCRCVCMWPTVCVCVSQAKYCPAWTEVGVGCLYCFQCCHILFKSWEGGREGDENWWWGSTMTRLCPHKLRWMSHIICSSKERKATGKRGDEEGRGRERWRKDYSISGLTMLT